ncbi:S24 family peptidase [Asticcacaulis excentricus]|nr:S24 family peptidase [Asticcacaulis excentricus]
MTDSDDIQREEQRKWLLQAISESGLTATALAKKAGLAATTVTRRVNPREDGHGGESLLKRETLLALAKAAGVSPPVLGAPYLAARSERRRVDDDEDSVLINQVDLYYGMGGGSDIGDHVEVEPRKFSRSWLRQISNANPKDLFWTTGNGDSNYPTIADGDILLIDMSQKKPQKNDQFWAITQYNLGQIKRLRATADGFQILSDNPQVPSDKATDGSMVIIGRLVAVLRKF